MAVDGEKLIEAVKIREVLHISTAKSYKDEAWGEVPPNYAVRDNGATQIKW